MFFLAFVSFSLDFNVCWALIIFRIILDKRLRFRMSSEEEGTRFIVAVRESEVL
jgi:hypothetical protein